MMSLSPGPPAGLLEVVALVTFAPDGRFLIVENTTPGEQSSTLQVIVNWRSLLPQSR